MKVCNKFYLLLTTLIFFTLLGCTAESKVKKLALNEVKISFSKKIETESKRVRSPQLAKSYKDVILDKTSFEVLKIQSEQGRMKLEVELKTVPYRARRVVLDILNKKDINAFSFNIPDAIRLVRQQLNIEDEQEVEAIFELEFANMNGDWMLQGFSSKAPQ